MKRRSFMKKAASLAGVAAISSIMGNVQKAVGQDRGLFGSESWYEQEVANLREATEGEFNRVHELATLQIQKDMISVVEGSVDASSTYGMSPRGTDILRYSVPLQNGLVFFMATEWDNDQLVRQHHNYLAIDGDDIVDLGSDPRRQLNASSTPDAQLESTETFSQDDVAFVTESACCTPTGAAVGKCCRYNYKAMFECCAPCAFGGVGGIACVLIWCNWCAHSHCTERYRYCR